MPYTYVWTVDYAGKPVFGGGENSIVAYAIDPATGEPTLIQHVDPRSVHVRTFAIDPSGRKYDVDTGGKIHYWMGMMGLG